MVCFIATVYRILAFNRGYFRPKPSIWGGYNAAYLAYHLANSSKCGVIEMKKLVSHSAALAAYKSIAGINTAEGSNYAILLRDYIGFGTSLEDNPKLSIKARAKVLDPCFRLFAQIILADTVVTAQQTSNFLEKLLCLAQIYARQNQQAPNQNDTELLTTTMSDLTEIITPYATDIQGDNASMLLKIINELDLGLTAFSNRTSLDRSPLAQAQPTVSIADSEKSAPNANVSIKQAWMVLGLAAGISIAFGVCLGLSLSTDILPDIESIWESEDREEAAKALVTPALAALCMGAGFFGRTQVAQSFDTLTAKSPTAR